MHVLKRICLIVIAILCGLLLLGGVARALVALKVVSLRTVTGMTAATLPSDLYGHTNILLLGQGDETHDGVDLTDSIMIASLDPGNSKSIVLLSIPRDLYFMETETMGTGRVNALFRDEKWRLIHQEDMEETEAEKMAVRKLADEIGKAFGLELHHVLKVDFVGFVKAVDALGGVSIVVPETIVDREYPGPNYGYETFMIESGPQTIDGETALKYARSRHTTSDFSRSARQQQIIKALGEKIKNDGVFSSPSKLLSLLEILQDHVQTTMTVRELSGLAEMGMDLDHSRMLAMQINNSNGLYGAGVEPGGFLYSPPRDQFGGASVMLPVSIPEFPVTWKQLQTLTRLLMHTRSPYLARPTINVLNAGARAGSSRLLAGELIRYGFVVDKIENAEIEDLPVSYISAGSEPDLELARFFAELLKLELRPLPPGLPPEKIGRIVIFLGEDYAYTPLQELLTNP